MKNYKKKLLSLVVTFCLVAVSLFVVPVQTKAADKTDFLTLGDSIASGYTLTNPTTQCFSALVATAMDASLTNEAENGMNSTTLLKQLTEDESVIAEVKSADVITISVGANDVLAPFLGYVESALDCTTVEEVQTKLATMLKTNDLAGFIAFEAAMETSLNADATSTTGITAAITAYATNLKQIMTAIRTDNPTAEVYVVNVYNPLKGITLGTFDGDTLGAAYVTKLNQIITTVCTAASCNVVDVYSTFKSSSAQMINAKVNVTTGTCSMDPHPTLLGHKTIATQLEKSMISNKSAYADELLADKGNTTTTNGLTFTVTKATTQDRTVTVTKLNKNQSSVTIPATVTINGYTYKITKIASKAFYGKSKLKTITCKTTTLTSVGANALKGIGSKAVIRVPSSKLAAYKKLFKGKGATVTVKAI